ncbi:MAG: V-type ATPase 116kDa subunit family protein [Bacillota bacterium]|nr:V-type ATPase 116kDa subunit family protein [Bacillota bacterium]
MAVLGMKFISIIGPVQELDNVVSSCLVGSGFHPEDSIAITKNLRGLSPFNYKNPYGDLLKQAISVSEISGIPLDYRSFSESEATDEEIGDYFLGMRNKINVLREEKNKLSRLVVEDQQIVLHLTYYGNLDARLEDLFHFTYAHFRFGRIPVDTYKNLEKHLEGNEDCYFFPSSEEDNYVYGMYFAPRAVIAKVDAIFSTFHFERIFISGKITGTPAEAINNLNNEIESSKKRIEEIDAQLSDLIKTEQDRFLTYYSKLRFLNDCYDIRKFASHTQDSFFIVGWIPETEIAAIAARVSKFEKTTYAVEDLDRAEDYTPPTKLVNNKVFKPFEFFIEMYGLPNYRELDPTPLMAICFTLLFGIMFGDVGQGLVLLIVGIVIYHLKGSPLAKIISYAGASATLFGFFYGSVFGSEKLLPGFKVLENSDSINKTLIGSLAVGVVFITIAMAMNVANGLRQKDFEKILFSSNGLAGFILYWSVLIAAIAFLMWHKQLITQWFVIFLIIVPLTAIFLKEPLAHILSGRKKWLPEKKGEFIMVNLIELFDVVLSFLTNTISFVRVGMFALNHAIMMMVVYTLSSLSGGSENIFVIIFGNIFVMALEGMIVGIQVMRLNFYEMFSRFYTGNGLKYKPFDINYKSSINNK